MHNLLLARGEQHAFQSGTKLTRKSPPQFPNSGHAWPANILGDLVVRVEGYSALLCHSACT
ncbi:hypothetical protein BCR34DRAFT_122654 [Clohesyomyces aquaticus]|uniref:Uncharacterized protein n=1 Tax=Clohesyomyces aquaticus TaxID=1231657 RepID=A0A1Y1YP45_9PLEO|nr:hypothetical protein BCR34DRAFT_122654 [Clohesyomyces aquaticus]